MTLALRCAAACSLALGLMSGCVVIPHRGKVYGPGGQAGSVDLGFLNPGISREEVRGRLKIFDAGILDDVLFWGRWRRKWDFYWFAAGGAETGATAAGGRGEMWRRRNVLVEFDASGKATGFRAVGDSEILRELAATARRVRSPNQPWKAELTFMSQEGEEISLKDGRISFGGRLSGAPRFACEYGNLTALRVTESDEDGLFLYLETSIRIGLRKKAGRSFNLTPQELWELIVFAEANGLDRILGVTVPASGR